MRTVVAPAEWLIAACATDIFPDDGIARGRLCCGKNDCDGESGYRLSFIAGCIFAGIAPEKKTGGTLIPPAVFGNCAALFGFCRAGGFLAAWTGIGLFPGFGTLALDCGTGFTPFAHAGCACLTGGAAFHRCPGIG